MRFKCNPNKYLSLTALGYIAFSAFIVNVVMQLFLYYSYSNSYLVENILFFIKSNNDGLSTLISIVAGLDAAILALAIPIMGERKIKIQESYQSDNLLNILDSDELINHYYLWVMMHFLLSIVILLVSNTNGIILHEIVYLIAMAVLLLTSCVIIIFLANFIKRFGEYESNPLDVKSHKLNLIKKSFYLKQDSFVFYIDLIGDVIKEKTKFAGKNKNIIFTKIDALSDYFKSFILEPEKHKFNFYTKEYRSLKEANPNSELLFGMTPEKYYVPLFPIKKIILLYKVAKNSNNQELAKYIIDQIEDILQISCSQDEPLFTEYVLRNLHQLITNASHWHVTVEKEQIISSDSYLGSLACDWYSRIVFDKYSNIKCKEKYLDILNKHLFEISKFLIQNNYLEIFKGIIQSYVNQIGIDRDENMAIKSKKFKETFVLIAAYCIFKKKFSFLNEIINCQNRHDSNVIHLNPDVFPIEIDEIINHFFNKDNFHERLYIFEDNHSPEEYLGQYLIILFLRFLDKKCKIKIQAEIADNKNQEPSEEFTYRVAENFSPIKDLKGYKIRELQSYFANPEDKKSPPYDKYKNAVDKVLKSREIMDIIHPNAMDDKNLKSALYKLLNNIAKDAKKTEDNRIKDQSISEEKIKEFRGGVVKTYESFRALKNVLENFGLFKHNSKSLSSKEKRLQITQIDKKEAYFDEDWSKNWAVYFNDWGGQYGRNIVRSENNALIGDIKKEILKKKKQNIKKEQLKDILGQLDNKEDVFILLNNHWMASEDELEGLNFIQKWHLKQEEQISKIDNFVGYLRFNEIDIPVFNLSSDKGADIIILNKSKFGTLNQYQPSFNKEGVEDLFGEDKEILIKVELYKNNEALLDEILNRSPEWLKEKGSIDEQKEYLFKMALVKIAIKSEFNFAKNFEGYIINI